MRKYFESIVTPRSSLPGALHPPERFARSAQPILVTDNPLVILIEWNCNFAFICAGGSGHGQIDQLECQWLAGRRKEGVSGFHRQGAGGYFLSAGGQGD